MANALKSREWENGGNCRVAYDGDLRRNVKRGYGINFTAHQSFKVEDFLEFTAD
jgi:hypothetical protein